MDDLLGVSMERLQSRDMVRIKETSFKADEFYDKFFEVEVLSQTDIDSAWDAISSSVSNHIIVEIQVNFALIEFC